jgi:LuxR family maltose regulon positive regulatory protein
MEFLQGRNFNLLAIRHGLLLVKAFQLSGEYRPAVRVMKEIIRLAAGTNIIMSFLEEGSSIADVLGRFLKAHPEVADHEREFAIRLLGLFPDRAMALECEPDISRQPNDAPVVLGRRREPASALLVEPLKPREREIIRFVGQGMTNREIGRKLGLTTGTVTWYLHAIYQKLGVDRRVQAVARAREFGFIN